MYLNSFRSLFFFFLTTISLVVFSCKEKNDPSTKRSTDPKVQKLKLPPGFEADHLYGPSETGDGSWVSMTFDGKGRLIASDQYGAIYRMMVPAIGDTLTKIKVERLDIPAEAGTIPDTSKRKISIGYAHGLLWAFNSLYVMINHDSDSDFEKGSGLYRLQDTDNDDSFDKMTLLKKLSGEGEHGPHSIVMAPDKKSLYVIAGNFTQIPEMNAYANKPSGKLDNLLPLIKDPNGHDNTVNWHGGWIAHTDSTGMNWELISSGLRNPFDLAFNDAGDMFTYDSDMEWDFGTPWYRPTRICHVTSGSEYGWRPGTGKWSPTWPDNSPAILNIGQGSPTNVVYGGTANFPEKYRKSVFAFDWSFGIIYAVHLQPKGSTYEAKGEEFISGSPLPLTDGVIGPDGAMYFLTGGRRLESDLYRVYYTGEKDKMGSIPEPALTAENSLRRKLEEYHGAPKDGALDIAWPNLKHDDRMVRYAARIALEHQPVQTWKQKFLSEKDPIIITGAAIAFARKGDSTIENKNLILSALRTVDYSKLSESQQIDILRAFELVMSRMGKPDKAVTDSVVAYLDPQFPSKGGNELNRELVKLLSYLDAPDIAAKTIAILNSAKDDNSSGQQQFTESSDLIMRNPQYGMDIANMLAKIPPAQQTYYATALSQVKSGWTPELRDNYFKWYYKAFSFKGGHSFVGFIDGARKNALKNIPKDRFAYFNNLSGDSIVLLSGTDLAKGAVQPKGPGRDWTVKEALNVVDSGLVNRNFDMGKAMFKASLCISCHTMNGEGGVAGPDLTQLGTRFSAKDMLESIIEPSKTISDQYAATIFELKSGSSVVGRMINQDKDKYYVSQNPFAQQSVREISKTDVVRTQLSPMSVMLPGMLYRLNPEEVKDLIAYLMAGGNKDHPIYKKK